MGRSPDHRKGIAIVALLAGLALAGCASDATFLRDGNVTPDPKQLETDASDCRDFGPLVGGFFVGAAYGAAEGAIIGATTTISTGPAAAVGGAAGAVVGLMVGAVTSADGDGFDRCMAEKGYHPAPVATGS